MNREEERQDNIRMLRESAGAICDRDDLGRARRLRFKAPGFDPALWREMGALGWLGLRVSEERGGSGLGMAEYCALAEELGAALVPEPLIAGILAAESLDGDRLAAVAAGEDLVLAAVQDDDPASPARFENGRLSGCKTFVPFPASASAFVVSTDRGLVLAEANSGGLEIEEVVLQDGTRAGTVTFRNAAAGPLNASLDSGLEDATLATSAYLLGVMDAALLRTLDYLNTRKQFNTLIGSFQALQHMAVDMKLQCALTRACVEEAARLADDGADTTARRAAVSRAKSRASEAGLAVTKLAVQLHGGIGYSDEHDIGLYLRKAMVLSPAYGGSRDHRLRYLDTGISQASAA